MSFLTIPISLVGLGATIVPALLFYSGLLGHDEVKWFALAGTIVWFAATPLWMGRDHTADSEDPTI